MAKQDDYVRYTIRVPADLYARIQRRAGEKSVNAEIVEALEQAYPAPRFSHGVRPFSDTELTVLQWHLGNWNYVEWDEWTDFRAGVVSEQISSRLQERNNYFVVCVFNGDGALVNIIPHNYHSTGKGISSAPFDLLNEAEIADYDRLMVAVTATEEGDKRIAELREKMKPALELPSQAVKQLIERVSRAAPPREAVEAVFRRNGLID